MILTRDRDLIVVSLFFADFRTQVTKEKYILVLLARRKKDAMSNISLKFTASAVKRAMIRSHMEMVEQAAIGADPDIYSYILRCVTSGVSYDKMVASGIPCSRDYFYDRYRKFFWILDGIRDFIPTYSGK